MLQTKESDRADASPTNHWLDTDDILGDIQHQEIVTSVEIECTHTGERGYHVKADRRSTRGDVLNMATAAAGMSVGSTLELGGDRLKRVTHTDVNGKTYVYVEVGPRKGDA